MTRLIVRAFGIFSTVFCCWSGAASASEAGSDLASQTRAVFAAKCAGCHGAHLPKPQGRFGYVLDLARVAANPEIVMPSFPDESEMWQLVRRGEMPPADAPTGPLTQQQKELIRAWIAAGAPADPSSPASHQDISSALSPEDRILRSLGAFHLLAVHFPIAFLIAAAGTELWCALNGSRIPAPAVRFCILLGAAAAVITATLGWIHAGNGHGLGSPQTLRLHRWIGTAAAAWAVGTALLSEREERRGSRSQWFLAWLFMGAILVAIEGHCSWGRFSQR